MPQRILTTTTIITITIIITNMRACMRIPIHTRTAMFMNIIITTMLTTIRMTTITTTVRMGTATFRKATSRWGA